MSKANVQIFANKVALAQAAAERFMLLAEAAVAARGRFCVALSGGSTPQAMFRLLSQPPFARRIPWEHAHVFWGDERLVPPGNEGSNYYHAARLLLNGLPLPAAHIHRAKGELEPAAAVADYKAQLAQTAEDGRSWPRFDLVLLGMGSDGHTASLFPGAPAAAEQQEPVIAATAEYEGRPAQRITLTPLVFNDARHVLFLIAGAGKAEALAAVLQGEHDPDRWPAQRIRPDEGTLSWFVDRAAAAELTLDAADYT